MYDTLKNNAGAKIDSLEDSYRNINASGLFASGHMRRHKANAVGSVEIIQRMFFGHAK